MYIKNMGALISKFIEAGPKNEAYNCVDYEMTWKEYVLEYARQLNVELKEQYKSIMSGLMNWGDKNILLMLGYSYFGAHYSDEKLQEDYGFEPPYSWKEGVADAIVAYEKSCPEKEKQILNNLRENSI